MDLESSKNIPEHILVAIKLSGSMEESEVVGFFVFSQKLFSHFNPWGADFLLVKIKVLLY